MLLLALLGIPGEVPGKWTPLETLRYRLVSDVQVSPDGRRVASVVRESIMEPDKSEYRTQIWLASTGGRDFRQATFSEQSSSRPRWSPDGKWLAFLSKRGDRYVNIWLLPTAGGESWRLTDVPGDVQQFAWSPDGQWIAFVEVGPKPDDHDRREREKDDARVVDEEDRPGRLSVISVPAVAGGAREGRQLRLASRSVGGSPDPAAPDALDWSPDGKTIAFSHTARPVANEWPSADISLVDVASGTVRPLAATGAAETTPRYSPDGRWIAYVSSDDPPRWAHQRGIRLAPADGGPARALPPSFDDSPELAGWSADGRTLYFTEARSVYDVLYAQNVETGALRALTEPGTVCNGAAVNPRGTWIGFVRQSFTEPSEAWASALSPFAPVRVSDANAALPRHPIGATRVVTWKGDRGEPIEGILTLPVEYEAGKRYPLLLVIHGGPANVFKATYLAAPSPYPLAVFSSEGYAVLRPNPRGSSGYGTAFRRANMNDWGGGDFRDLMAGVDAVVAMGIADPDRLGVMGWSYGGYMASWIITQTDRFQAASIGAPVTDLVSFTGTADIPSFVPDYFGGEFWDDEGVESYAAHSAIGQIGKAKTPALIQHGDADVRVPISQSYELYNALKRRGVPATMVVYPRQPHAPREPRLVRDLGERNLAWMDRWVKGVR